jgi:hypothetical protein
MLTINLRLSYKDHSGDRFETEITLSHHPLIHGSPFMYIQGSKRLGGSYS